MFKKLLFITLLILPGYLVANVPNFNDPKLLDDMPGYEGTNIPEVGYKDQDMNALANQQIANDPDGVGRYMADTANNRPRYDFSNSEIVNENRYSSTEGEFLTSDKYTNIIDQNYEDCTLTETSF